MSATGASRPSIAVFCVALAAVGVGTAVGLAAVPRVGTFLGMLLGGFVVGVGASNRPLAESAAAAAAVNLGTLAIAGVPGTGLTGAIAALGSVAPEVLLPSLALSAAAGGFGAHLGNDLRDGLLKPIEDPGTTGTGSASSPDRARNIPPTSTPVPDDDTTPANADADRETVRESTDE